MQFANGNLKLYRIDKQYVKHLHQIDSEVWFDNNYSQKPYVGILTTISGYNYFIPLTSAKSKHSGWRNVTDHNYLIYEFVGFSHQIPSTWVYKPSGKQIKHIIAVLEIKKMIPAPQGTYHEIIFNTVQDLAYRTLLMKEYAFLRPLMSDIIRKAQTIYQHQKQTGRVLPQYCDFVALEQACDTYIP